MNTWMNNKFNKQEFPTGNVKQIILQSALNFNQSLSITLAPRLPSASAESALGVSAVLGGRHRSMGQSVLSLLTQAGFLARLILVVCISKGLGNWWVMFPQCCFSHILVDLQNLGSRSSSRWSTREKQMSTGDWMNWSAHTRKQDCRVNTCSPGWMVWTRQHEDSQTDSSVDTQSWGSWVEF